MMIAFVTCNSSLVPWIQGLCSSYLWELEFSGLDEIEPTTQKIKEPRSDQLSHACTWEHCELFYPLAGDLIGSALPSRLRSFGPGQFLGLQVVNQLLTIRFVQWLGCAFEPQERRRKGLAPRKKESAVGL